MKLCQNPQYILSKLSTFLDLKNLAKKWSNLTKTQLISDRKCKTVPKLRKTDQICLRCAHIIFIANRVSVKHSLLKTIELVESQIHEFIADFQCF